MTKFYYLRINLILGALFYLSVAWVSQASANVFVFDATNRGFCPEFQGCGFSVGGSTSNYVVGELAPDFNDLNIREEYRNYFFFDLVGLSGKIVKAELQLEMPRAGFLSFEGSEVYTLFDIIVDFFRLGTIDGGYEDLASGTVYGSTELSTSDNGSTVVISLNEDAVENIASNTDKFGIGGAITSINPGGNVEVAFGFTEGFRTQLVVTTEIPIPTSILLFASLLFFFFGARICSGTNLPSCRVTYWYPRLRMTLHPIRKEIRSQ